MDDEDIREREESRQISVTGRFAGFGTQDDPTAQYALGDLFIPSHDSIGEKLLNKMGWKKGQGIGPRVLRRIDPNDASSEMKEFPPEDSPMLELAPKNDMRGLGFGNDGVHQATNTSIPSSKPLSGQSVVERNSLGPSFADFTPEPRESTKPLGIRISSRNDTGSDDDDPYELGPKMSYNRVLGSEKKQKKVKSSVRNANPMLKSQPIFKSKKLSTLLSASRKCHDGKLPLTGFVLADLDGLHDFSTMDLSDEKCKPPEVPEGWQPNHLLQDPEFTMRDSASLTRNVKLTHQTPQSRAKILKEAPLPSKSVFDYLSPAARDRLVAASGRTDLPPALGEAPLVSIGEVPVPSVFEGYNLDYPYLDPTIALTAMTRLRKDKDKPYDDDLPKQGRYKDFLRFSSDSKLTSERVPPLRAPSHRTDDEHLEELNEFATTANLFRPASGFLASKFTSAASSVVSLAGNGISSSEQCRNGQDSGNLIRNPHKKPTDPAEEAARIGMFGVATRSTVGFFPTKLLCKRFGVDVPGG